MKWWCGNKHVARGGDGCRAFWKWKFRKSFPEMIFEQIMRNRRTQEVSLDYLCPCVRPASPSWVMRDVWVCAPQENTLGGANTVARWGRDVSWCAFVCVCAQKWPEGPVQTWFLKWQDRKADMLCRHEGGLFDAWQIGQHSQLSGRAPVSDTRKHTQTDRLTEIKPTHSTKHSSRHSQDEHKDSTGCAAWTQSYVSLPKIFFLNSSKTIMFALKHIFVILLIFVVFSCAVSCQAVLIPCIT